MMKTKQTIFLDMDETLYDMAGHWFKLYNERYDDDVDPAEMNVWDVGAFGRLKIPAEEMIQIFHEENFFYDLRPYPGAVEAVSWAEANLPVRHVILTHSVTRTGAYDKMRAIQRDFPFIPIERFLVTGGAKDIAPAMMMIDDRPKYLTEFARTYPNSLTTAFDQNYNKDVVCDYRLYDWSDYIALVSEALDVYEDCPRCG